MWRPAQRRRPRRDCRFSTRAVGLDLPRDSTPIYQVSLVIDGESITDAEFAAFETFGAFTFRPDAALGSWAAGDHRYDDRLFSVIVDVDDTVKNRAWISHLKSHLLQRFEQLEIYVTSYPIDVH